MLLSSIGRASFERAVTTISCSKNRVLHILLNAHRIKSTYVKKVSLSINSVDFSRQSYATAAGSASGVKKRSTAPSTKSRRLASKGKGTKTSKKVSSTSKKRKIVKKVIKKPRKVLTEKEKLTRKQTSLKLIALKLPEKLPQTARTLFMAEKLKGSNGANINAKFAEISTSWGSLSPMEIQSYEKRADANRVANEKSLKDWLSKYSPDQIRLANNARKQMSKFFPKSKQWKQIQDERQPKRPLTPFLCFVKERYSSGEYAGTNLPEVSKKLTSEFKALTPIDRKKYDNMYRLLQKKYIEEFRQAFSRDPRCDKLVVE